jgi:hypothetical protein
MMTDQIRISSKKIGPHISMKSVREKIDKYYGKDTRRRSQKENLGSNRFECKITKGRKLCNKVKIK